MKFLIVLCSLVFGGVAMAGRFELINAQVWNPVENRNEGMLFRFDTETGDVWRWEITTLELLGMNKSVVEKWQLLDENYTRERISTVRMIFEMGQTNKVDESKISP